MSLRARHAELTRTAILAAARRLFAAHGFASTAVRPIAEEAGVAVQTLYSTFGSKQGLLLALVDTIRPETNAPARWDEVAASGDAEQAVRRAASLRRIILERCGDIVRTFREGAVGDPQVAQAYAEGQRRSREGIDRLCARLAELGVPLDRARAVDAVAALFAAEVFEELTGPRSGWSMQEYEDWLAARLRDVLLRP